VIWLAPIVARTGFSDGAAAAHSACSISRESSPTLLMGAAVAVSCWRGRRPGEAPSPEPFFGQLALGGTGLWFEPDRVSADCCRAFLRQG